MVIKIFSAENPVDAGVNMKSGLDGGGVEVSLEGVVVRARWSVVAGSERHVQV